MKIDRKRVKRIFDDYVSRYDISDEKISLKISHTYRVSGICEKIAESLGFSKEDMDLAWLIGMLHDIGRFEQERVYGTFKDAESYDHGKIGASILFDEGMIRKVIDDDGEDDLIYKAVLYHNAYKVPKSLCGRTAEFIDILRDADKIDIFKVSTDVSLEKIYNVTRDEIYNSEISSGVMGCIEKHETVLRSLKCTAADNIAGHIALIFGLVFSESFKIVKEQGYLERLVEFKTQNPYTKAQFDKIHVIMDEFINERIKA